MPPPFGGGSGFFFKNPVEQFTLVFGKQPIARLRVVSFFQSLKWQHRPGHALAVADTALAAHLDFQDRLARCSVFDDLHVAVFEPHGFVGAQTSVRYERHEVVQLFALPLVAFLFRTLGPTAPVDTFLGEYEILTAGQRNAKYVQTQKDRLRVYLVPFFGNRRISVRRS